MLYTPEQIELMQEDILRNIYGQVINPKTQKAAGWSTLQQIIAGDSEYLLENNRANLPPEFKEIKEIDFGIDKANLERFAKKLVPLSDPQHLLLDLYLTDPSNEFTKLTFEKLHNVIPTISKEAVILANFFHAKTDEKSNVTLDKFKDEYECKTIKNYSSDGTRMISYNLKMKTEKVDGYENVLGAKIFGNSTILESDSEPTKIVWFGWLIIAPEDNLYIMFQDEVKGHNHLLLPVGFNEEAFSKKGKVKFMCFLDQQIAVGINQNSLVDSRLILDEWLSNNQHNLLIFDDV